MGLIKRQQLEQLAQPAPPVDPEVPSSTFPPPPAKTAPQPVDDGVIEPEDDWSWEAFLSGDVPDRRQTDERRETHRRDADQQVLATAHEEAEHIRENAYQSGYADGLEQAEQALNDLKDQFALLLQDQSAVIDDMVKQLGPLSVAIAEKILKAEVSCDEALTERLARETLQKAGRDVKTVLIKVHPEQLTKVRAAFRDNPPDGLRAELSVVDDDSVDWGSCVVETDSGLIDARFSTQLAILQKLLY
jgi:flagellar assembly protein FliH